jgi:hypothetical protein
MEDTKMDSIEKNWTDKAKNLLLGRKIVAVRYMTQKEADSLGWHSRGVVIQLDNGLLIYPSRDDEGNDSGALFTSDENEPTLPVL